MNINTTTMQRSLRTPAVLAALVLLSVLATSLVAQTPPRVPESLTLDEAIRLARDYNPVYLSTRNDQAAADWGVREAYSAFLPTASINGSVGYLEGGTQRFGNIDLGVAGTDFYQSDYSLSLQWQLSGNTIFGVPAARANQNATDARIDAAEFNLESQVAQQYMIVLRMQDGMDVAERQLARAQQNRQIVSTRVSAGAAAGTEGRQADVDLGRAEVGVIQAERQYREALAMLGEQIGLPLDGDTGLSTDFTVFEPTWEREELIAAALNGHPSLRSFAAQETAARATAKQAASSYFPTLAVFTGLRGNTQKALSDEFVIGDAADTWASRQSNCEFQNALIQGVPTLSGDLQDCSTFAFTEQRRLDALTANDQFPFDFTRRPLSVTMQLSVPIFTGFTRQRQVSQAYNQAEDARYNLRAEELRLRTAVTQAYDNLSAAYRVVQLEERNRALAEEQLSMQQRRYALGASAMLELLDAQTTLSTAEQAYLNARYDFHWNLIRLEAAVGQPLRPELP